mmetsp:Transcript_102402/g.293136  ORF Transcript_102402/g.293136 Transcript_102402/m.293136 type:complete len:667 (-) Transcript_102402:209-2209(-)
MTGILAAATLADAQKNARSLRVAVSGSTCAVGMTMLAAGMPLGWLRFFEILPESWGPVGWYWIMAPALIITQIAIMPTDEDIIRKLLPFFSVFYSVGGAAGFVGGFVLQDRYATCPSTTCTAWLAGFCSAGLGMLCIVLFVLVPPLREPPPPRLILESLWVATRSFYGVVGLSMLIAMAIITATNSEFRKLPDCPAYLICFSSWVFMSAITTKRMRDSVHAVLQDLLTAGEAHAAAGVAALVGQLSPEEALKLGQENFRALPFTAMNSETFSSNQETKGLYEATEPCELGDVDAFLSHSWSDDGEVKWRVLNIWATAFEAREGRKPKVWLDKACINQQKISESLAGLPIYLSGCTELVVLMGETYLSRLWCIMEIYTFFRMGGSLERIVILPVKQPHERMDYHIETFRAENCQCFLEEDRQRLLAVVETGFGNLSRFGHTVKSSLRKCARMTADGRRVSPTVTGSGKNMVFEGLGKNGKDLMFSIEGKPSWLRGRRASALGLEGFKIPQGSFAGSFAGSFTGSFAGSSILPRSRRPSVAGPSVRMGETKSSLRGRVRSDEVSSGETESLRARATSAPIPALASTSAQPSPRSPTSPTFKAFTVRSTPPPAACLCITTTSHLSSGIHPSLSGRRLRVELPPSNATNPQRAPCLIHPLPSSSSLKWRR